VCCPLYEVNSVWLIFSCCECYNSYPTLPSILSMESLVSLNVLFLGQDIDVGRLLVGREGENTGRRHADCSTRFFRAVDACSTTWQIYCS